MIDLLSLRKPRARWLSPPVVILKVHVVQIFIRVINTITLVVPGWNVALLVEVFWPDLSDMHVNQEGVMTIDLHQLLLVVAVNINRMKV
jgi:hypothetical protein